MWVSIFCMPNTTFKMCVLSKSWIYYWPCIKQQKSGALALPTRQIVRLAIKNAQTTDTNQDVNGYYDKI